jgi:hypothetical protein
MTIAVWSLSPRKAETSQKSAVTTAIQAVAERGSAGA